MLKILSISSKIRHKVLILSNSLRKRPQNMITYILLRLVNSFFKKKKTTQRSVIDKSNFGIHDNDQDAID